MGFRAIHIIYFNTKYIIIIQYNNIYYFNTIRILIANAGFKGIYISYRRSVIWYKIIIISSGNRSNGDAGTATMKIVRRPKCTRRRRTTYDGPSVRGDVLILYSHSWSWTNGSQTLACFGESGWEPWRL